MTTLPPPWDLFFATVEGRESTMSVALVDGLPSLSFQPIPQGAAPNLALLVTYLRSEHPIPIEVRAWLANMLDDAAGSESLLRMERRARGRPPAPADRHWDAAEAYLELCKTTHEKDALGATLATYGIEQSTLRAAIAGYRAALETAARVERENGPR